MDLYHQLDYCAWQLKKAAADCNEAVRRRIQKLYEEMEGLRPWVQNIAVFKDCIPENLTSRGFANVKFVKRACAKCGKDLTYLGGWVYPQEPKKMYCSHCQSEKFDQQIKESEVAK